MHSATVSKLLWYSVIKMLCEFVDKPYSTIDYLRLSLAASRLA